MHGPNNSKTYSPSLSLSLSVYLLPIVCNCSSCRHHQEQQPNQALADQPLSSRLVKSFHAPLPHNIFPIPNSTTTSPYLTSPSLLSHLTSLNPKITPFTLSSPQIDPIFKTQIQNPIFRKGSVSDLKTNDFAVMEKSGGCAVVKQKLTAEQQQQQHQEQLPCPRCHSTNTKFCYYNNYNFSQPRHFCKSCRRYWTHGGTLRDIPVGGGSRKSAKRCRTSSSYTSTSSIVTPTSSYSSHEFLNSTPAFLPSSAAYGSVCGGGGFTSLLTGHQGPGVWALGGGFGLGIGSGLADETGFGLGKSGFAFGDIGYGGTNGGAAVVGSGGGGATWEIESGENGGFGAGGDGFGWPGLAISTPGNGLK